MNKKPNKNNDKFPRITIPNGRIKYPGTIPMSGIIMNPVQPIKLSDTFLSLLFGYKKNQKYGRTNNTVYGSKSRILCEYSLYDGRRKTVIQGLKCEEFGKFFIIMRPRKKTK